MFDYNKIALPSLIISITLKRDIGSSRTESYVFNAFARRTLFVDTVFPRLRNAQFSVASITGCAHRTVHTIAIDPRTVIRVTAAGIGTRYGTFAGTGWTGTRFAVADEIVRGKRKLDETDTAHVSHVIVVESKSLFSSPVCNRVGGPSRAQSALGDTSIC